MVEEDLDGVVIEPIARSTAPLPARNRRAELEVLRNDGMVVAIAAAGGVVAGAATVVVAGVAKAGAKRAVARAVRRQPKPKVVATQRFVVDVHMLGE